MTEKLLLMDVDGTLAESGRPLENEMVRQLCQMRAEGFVLGIVGGGRFEKIREQMGPDLLRNITHFFTECGCVYHRRDDDDLVLVHSRNIRDHVVWPCVNELIKVALRFLSSVHYPITGHFIDLRSGIVYISLIGMVATLDERHLFLQENSTHNYIDHLLNDLKEQSRLMGTLDQIDIVRGGSVGITIYPSEWDKVQVVGCLKDNQDIYYIGDKYEKDGNDYQLLHHPNVKGFKTDSPDMTRDILDKIRRMTDSLPEE